MKNEAENPYRTEMKGIAYKVAMQSIRKVIRDPKTNDTAKLNIIMAIVHDVEEDLLTAEDVEERRAIREDEEKMRKDKIDDLFSGMTEAADELLRTFPEEGK